MKNKKGFTLVELLAVIVILGIILLIAVPKIMTTISNATNASMESSAKMLAASAEREYTVRQALGTSTSFACTDIASLSVTDYDLDPTRCTVSVDPDTGVATIDLEGKTGGKFAGKYVCNATRTSATVGDVECNASAE